MFSGLFSLSNELFRNPKKRTRQLQRASFHQIEDLETRQLLSASGTGDDSGFTPRIINPIATQPTDLNWATDYQAVGAFLNGPTAGSTTAPTTTNYVGTGTVIKNVAGSIWVLTSAQLATNLTTSNTFYVNTGTIAAPVYTNYAISSIVKHSKFTPTINGVNNLGNPSANDVALVKLTYAVSAAAAALPNIVAAPILETTPPTPSKTTKDVLNFVGWGETGTDVGGQGANPGTKNYGKATATSLAVSAFNWTFNNTVALPQSNLADGDIGAPAFLKANSNGSTQYYVAGITSWGSKAATGHTLGEARSDTRVDIYAQWMHDVMGDPIPASVAVDDFKDLVNAAFGTPSASAFNNTDKKVTLASTGVTASASITNTLNTRADHDVVKFVVGKNALANIKYVSNDFDPVFQIYSETVAATATTAATTVSLGAAGAADDIAGSKLRDAYATNVSLTPGTYYIDLSSYHDPAIAGTNGSGKGKGTLTFALSYDEDGGGNSVSTPINTKVLNSAGAMTASGALQVANDVDYYRFKATVTGLMQVDVRSATGFKVDTQMEVYDSTGTNVLPEQVSVDPWTDDLTHVDDTTGLTVIDSLASRKTVSVTAGQYYYVKISGVSAAVSAAKTGLPTTLTGYGPVGGYSLLVKTFPSL
jgi:hypothetical protein